MCSGWGSLPLLPLGYILEHLSLEDALTATAISRHWRAGLLMYEGRRDSLSLHMKECEKSEFLARMFKKYVRVLHVHIEDSSEEEISSFMTRVVPQFFDTIELEELIFIGPGCGQPAPHAKIHRLITESLVSKHSHCLQKFGLMNCELDTVDTIKENEVPESVEYYSRGLRFDSPSEADAVLSRHNAEAMMFSSLQLIIADYDQVTTETLETLSQLSSFTQLSAILCNSDLAIQTVDWRRALTNYRHGLSVALNLIYIPAKKIDEVVENVLVEDMPLTSLKVMFCKNLHAGLIKHVVRVHKARLRELVWADAPHEGACTRVIRAARSPEYDARNVNPLILLCWQCTRLRRLVIHGYWLWQYDIVGFVRLRKSLQKMEISAVCGRQRVTTQASLARVLAGEPADPPDATFEQQVNEFAEFNWKPTVWCKLHPALRERASAAERAHYVAYETRRPLAELR